MSGLLPAIEIPLRIMLVAPVFFMLFIGLCYWVYSGKRSASYEEAGKMPLED